MATIREIGPTFAARAVEHDNADRFVSANYADLKQRRLFSAQIPTDLGGGGCTHSQMCGLIRELAGYCGSTALAFSMHQHLVAAAAWNNRHGRPGEQLLRKVPEESVALRRPRGQYHPVWNVVLTVALPLICAAYVGIAEAAARIARDRASERDDDGLSSLLVGEMENELTAAQIAFDSMVSIANDQDVEPQIETANDVLIRKTLVTQAVVRTAEKALEATGGAGYFRAMGLERLVRDAQAGQFHPLQPKKQHRFTGPLSMGLDPIEV